MSHWYRNIINILESVNYTVINNTDSPPNHPYFQKRGGEMEFHDPVNGIVAGVDISEGNNEYCAIYDFSSSESGKGHARKSLQWLRKQFNTITVHDIGEEGDDSFLFWNKMLDEGLVDVLYDADDNEIS